MAVGGLILRSEGVILAATRSDLDIAATMRL